MNPTKTNGFTEDWKNTKLEEASLEVSTLRFREQIARSKKTPAQQATLNLALISGYPVDSATKRFNNRDQMFSE